MIMSIAMVAMLAFGGTFAYFTAENASTSTTGVTTGSVVLGTNSIVGVTTAKIVTNTVIATGVTVESDSDVDTWVVVKFSVDFDGTAAEDSVIDFEVDSAWGSAIAGTNGNYYVQSVTAGENTSLDVCDDITFIGSDKATTDEDGTVSYENEYMGKTITVTVQSWAIQKTGNDTAEDALVSLGLKSV